MDSLGDILQIHGINYEIVNIDIEVWATYKWFYDLKNLKNNVISRFYVENLFFEGAKCVGHKHDYIHAELSNLHTNNTDINKLLHLFNVNYKKVNKVDNIYSFHEIHLRVKNGIVEQVYKINDNFYTLEEILLDFS